MKMIIIFLAAIFYFNCFAQYSGTTETGSILPPKKENTNVNTIASNTPRIVLLVPTLNGNNEVVSNAKFLDIKGVVYDSLGVKTVKINGVKTPLGQDNSFLGKIKLTSNINNITITAENKGGVVSNFNFNVIRDVDLKGPIVKIIEPMASRGIKIIKKSEVVTVKGVAIDQSGVKEVYVNDQKASLANTGEFRAELYLHIGDNRIVVNAIDNVNNSTLDTFIVTRKLEDVISAGRYIGFVIGIDSYEGYWPELNNAADDAEGVAKVLKDDYTFDTVFTLIDKKATRKNIIDEFQKLTTYIKPEDNLLIFYAGHGQYNKVLNKGYWVPVDANSNSIADFISNSDIQTFIGGIPSKHTLLITDACFAGDIFRGKPTESIKFNPNDMERYYREVYKKVSRAAITSGSLEEVSDAGKGGHSVFTYYLIKSLKSNEQKFLDASQLFNDFRVAVTNNSEQTPEYQVLRDTNDEGGQFVFVRRGK